MKGKRIRTKALSILLVFMMVVGLLPMSALAATVDSSYQPGTYTGEAQGYDGTVCVTVTLQEQDGAISISDISATGDKETPKYWSAALSVLDEIKDKNGTTGVDVVTGATKSSKGIINATDAALSKAISGFVGGTGEQADPYLISSEAGMKYLAEQVANGETYAGKYVKLTQDVQLTGEWKPIGSSSTLQFAGTFDGANHTIDGMQITDSTLGYVGLFGYLGKGGSVKNVSLTNVSIDLAEAAQNVFAGSLIAFMQNDTSGSTVSVVDNCRSEGTLRIHNSDKTTVVGGLIGMSNQLAAVTNCGVNVQVEASSGTGRATVGGLTAWASIRALYMNNYSLGNVTVDTQCEKFDNVGGMFGQVNGILYNCYTAGTVTLTGEGYPTPAGAFAGNLAAATYADNCYYADQEAAFCGTSSGAYNAETVLKKTAEEMKSEEFAQLLHNNLSSDVLAVMAEKVTAAGISGCSDFHSMTARVDNKFQDWAYENGVVALTGMLWTSGEIDTGIFASGDGTEENPYLICDKDQLNAFAASLSNKVDYTNKYVALGADIDLSGSAWTPIGGSEWAFNGTFDGKGFAISGMTVGAKDSPLALDSENIYIGLFGVLGNQAVVKNVNLTEIGIYVTYQATAYVGGIAGYMAGTGTANDYTGAIIDGCSVSGEISYVSEAGNQFVGGLVGMQYKGAVINSMAKVDASCVVTGGDLAEVGGLVGLVNRGLVANCWSDGNLYGSGNRQNGNEGMAVVSNLVACNAGALVNCYASGNTKTKEYSTYVGMVSGWVTGIGKSYTCWYNQDSTMFIGEDDVKQNVNPVEPIGTKVASGVNDEGDAFTGGLVDKMTGYKADTYASIAEAMNATFAAFPIDITLYGLQNDALKNWTYDAEKNLVTFSDKNGSVTYVQPECEKIEKPEQVMNDGVWYGRDDDKTTVVKITVASGEITNTEVLSGENSGEAYDAALAKAKYKAVYGDFSHYDAADVSKFAGGSGTEADPYLISDEAQLRYLSASVNEDVDWKGVYFKQTNDIALTGGDWQPIGWGLNGDVNGKKTQIGAYPFRGNYDGGDYTITGLTIGTEDAPADQMTSGLFGLTAGELNTNEKPTGEEQTVSLKNIHLQDVSIFVSTRYETYTGGLVGCAQNGIYIDNCSVTGKLDVTTSESFARAGGLSANVLRGAVTNSWTDVDIQAVTDTNHVYAGGLYAMDNRVTTLNCYALGDVTGNSTNNNKVHIGGIAGQAGGIHYNCYATGNVISLKTTTDVGGLNGRSGGIAADYNCYYNSEAVQKQGDVTNAPAIAIGVNANDNALVKNVEGKTAEELASKAFAAQLNGNLTEETLAAAMEDLEKFLSDVNGRGFVHNNYYLGNALLSWALIDGVVTFGEEPTAYSITVEDPENGSVSVSPDSAISGETVTITVTPDEGYKLDQLTVQDGNGSALTVADAGDHTYTFEMPASNVVISATFAEEKTDPVIPFTDVPADSYYADAVAWAVAQNITTGTSETTFSPDDSCTRAQMVVFLWRAAGNPEPTSTSCKFEDVNPESYYYKAVLWAVENGITNGTSETAFHPERTVTRAQVATFLYRYNGSPAISGEMPFADVVSGQYYYDAVLWAAENGITMGTSETTFSPDSDCTRAQIVVLLYRYMAE